MFPRVVVFDLDGTWWCPDMYELWGGGGAPFKRMPNTDSAMLDRGKNTVKLLDGTMRLVSELWHWQQNHDPSIGNVGNRGSSRNNQQPFIVAAASTCDEPRWAKELLTLFHTRPFPFDRPVLIGNGTGAAVNTATATSCGRGGGGKKNNTNDDELASFSSAAASPIVLRGDADLSGANGGIVAFEEVLGAYDEIYGGNKRTHMANILQKVKQNKVKFTNSFVTSNGGDIFIPPLFAAALPEGCAVCPATGRVSFTNPATEAALRQQLKEEDEAPVSFKDFIFFDNQSNNIHDCSKANICSVYVPEGMTMSNWARGLQQWRREQRPF